MVSTKKAEEWIKTNPKNREIVKLFSTGSNLAKNVEGVPDRYIIDFSDMSLEDANNYDIPFRQVKSILPHERKNNRNQRLKDNWWKYEGNRNQMRSAIALLSCYFTVPRVSKWAVFLPAPLNWLPGDLSVVVASDDFYVLGILTSNVHRLWVKAQSSTLKGDTRYTHTTCFETFPFPQPPRKGGSRTAPTDNLVQQIRNKTIALHEYRTQQMEQKQWGITQLYNEYFDEPASKLYQLHQELDKLVMQAYKFKADDNILVKLLELNFELTEKEKRGEKVIGAESP